MNGKWHLYGGFFFLGITTILILWKGPISLPKSDVFMALIVAFMFAMIPDMDFKLWGPASHRSFFTHSFLFPMIFPVFGLVSNSDAFSLIGIFACIAYASHMFLDIFKDGFRGISAVPPKRFHVSDGKYHQVKWAKNHKVTYYLLTTLVIVIFAVICYADLMFGFGPGFAWEDEIINFFNWLQGVI